MNLDIQYQIKKDPNSLRYLRQNSYWYKYLNRNPLLYKDMINEMKEKYKLRTSDKVTDTIEKISLIQSLLSVLK